MEKQGSKTQEKHRRRPTVVRYNAVVMKKMRLAIEADPSVDLSTVLPNDYSARRNKIKLQEEAWRIEDAKGVLNQSGLPALTYVGFSAYFISICRTQRGVDLSRKSSPPPSQACESRLPALG